MTDCGDGRPRSRKRVALVFVLVLGSLWALWEGYQLALGGAPAGRGRSRVDDLTMPHLHDDPAAARSSRRPQGTDLLARTSSDAALFTAKEAAVGFAIGAVVGFVLGVVLAQFDVLRRGVMPYVVASQTIPILAIAPMVVVGLGSVSINGWPPADWVRVVGDRRLPDVLPGHGQHAPRPAARPIPGRSS